MDRGGQLRSFACTRKRRLAPNVTSRVQLRVGHADKREGSQHYRVGHSALACVLLQSAFRLRFRYSLCLYSLFGNLRGSVRFSTIGVVSVIGDLSHDCAVCVGRVFGFCDLKHRSTAMDMRVFWFSWSSRWQLLLARHAEGVCGCGLSRLSTVTRDLTAAIHEYERSRCATASALVELARDGKHKSLEPISKSSEEDNKASKLDKAEEVLGVVLPADEDAALPLNPSEEALDEPASHVAA